MRDLIHRESITEGRAMNMIFDAARDNAERVTRYHLPSLHRVEFRPLFNGREHEAVLIREDGLRVAIAIVDEFDI